MTARAALVVAAWVLLAALAAAGDAHAATVPHTRPLVADGATGRVLLDQPWALHTDPGDRGLRAHWERGGPAAGWRAVAIPNAFNAGDLSSRSYIGAPAWYRTSFRLPAASRDTTWRVRFLAVNHRATVWLNGVLVGEHTGGYMPFEVPLSSARPDATNRLVVRVDNRRLPTDFPPSGFTRADEPRGGWWNWGGIVREVELRRVRRVDLEDVQVVPALGCAGCAASVRVRVTARNVSATAQRVTVSGRFGGVPLGLGTVRVAAGATATLSTVATIPAPRLWWPSDPFLYEVALTASASAGKSPARTVAGYRLHTGLRVVRVSGDGRLTLNGRPLSLRGVAAHEDVPGKGTALGPEDRAQLIAGVKDVGATLLRAHYPLHPQTLEMADRQGILVWSEVPVYRMISDFLAPASVRDAAVDLVRNMVLANRNHASVLVWSIGNELEQPTLPGPVRRYIAAASAVAHALDPSRPVGMAVEAHEERACDPAYAPLDVIGANEYFGWYRGRSDDVSGYLDRLRECQPRKAIMVTEFGAEANRDGPATEKGTYAFQQAFITRHLAIFATKPWLSGASYWTLREFACAPGWAGGNPKPQAPMHQKGVLTYAGAPKPAYADLQASFRATPQAPGPVPAPAAGPPVS